MDLRMYPGYAGVHTREQADGAIPNGRMIVKVMAEPGDPYPVGTRGMVLGSVMVPQEVYERYGSVHRHIYFIEWENTPRVAVGVLGNKIGLP